MKLKIYLYILILFVIHANLVARVGDWTTFTNQGDIRDLILVDNIIWCASNGGVFSYEISADKYQLFNNTNGLSAIGACAIEIEQRGNIWVGFAEGWLNYYNRDSKKWNYVLDYEGHQIYDLKVTGDTLLVALDIGISLYDLQRKEVTET